MTNRPVLVTGCAGFIGSTLVDRLLADGHEVAGLDAFEPFYPAALKEPNLAQARRSAQFRFETIDTRDRVAVSEYVKTIAPSTIVDLAARAGVRDSLRDPWLYIDINITGLQNVLAAAADVGASVVFASSSSVYGNLAHLPFAEDDVRLQPTSPYGATKVAGEALLAAHHEITGLPVRAARLFTVYGPRQRPDLAVRKFADAIMRARPLSLYAEGRATRDYTFVGDIVDGFVRLIDSTATTLTVNLGAGRPYSTLEMLKALEGALGRTAVVEQLPAQPGDMKDTFADISRARATLGWEPKISLEDGLRSFADWYLAEPDVRLGAA